MFLKGYGLLSRIISKLKIVAFYPRERNTDVTIRLKTKYNTGYTANVSSIMLPPISFSAPCVPY